MLCNNNYPNWSRIRKLQTYCNIINLDVSISEWIDRINTLVINLHFFSVALQESQEEMVFQELLGKQEKMAVQEIRD